VARLVIAHCDFLLYGSNLFFGERPSAEGWNYFSIFKNLFLVSAAMLCYDEDMV
jgi:hypothetical protein